VTLQEERKLLFAWAAEPFLKFASRLSIELETLLRRLAQSQNAHRGHEFKFLKEILPEKYVRLSFVYCTQAQVIRVQGHDPFAFACGNFFDLEFGDGCGGLRIHPARVLDFLAHLV
jgi:hypothetical protein